jgi:dihydroorotase
MGLLLRGGRVIDPSQDLDARADVLIEEGRIAAVGTDLYSGGHETQDVSGGVVCPGLIDLHVHFREPGQEYKETIATGALAAAAGGFTAVCCMPNTDPAIDDPSVVELIRRKTAEACGVRVYVNAALSKGNRGEELAELGRLADAGAVMFSDDAFPIQDSELMRRAMEYARMLGRPVTLHSEDKCLSGDGAMNEGPTATVLGLRGIPNAAEDVMVARNIELARLTGVQLHLCHISTAVSVELVRRAKAEGLPVTAEACPHHFTLTDEACAGYNTNAKVNPPLRSEVDRLAVCAGLQDGTLDSIATDHAPHAAHEKECEFDRALFGLVGLETVVPLTLDRLVRPGILSLPDAVAKLSTNPGRVLNGQRAGGRGQGADNPTPSAPCPLPVHPLIGTLQPGAPADVTVLDLERRVRVRAAQLYSKSKNTPFDGWEMTGAAVLTMVGGRVIMRDGVPVEIER